MVCCDLQNNYSKPYKINVSLRYKRQQNLRTIRKGTSMTEDTEWLTIIHRSGRNIFTDTEVNEIMF